MEVMPSYVCSIDVVVDSMDLQFYLTQMRNKSENLAGK